MNDRQIFLEALRSALAQSNFAKENAPNKNAAEEIQLAKIHLMQAAGHYTDAVIQNSFNVSSYQINEQLE